MVLLRQLPNVADRSLLAGAHGSRAVLGHMSQNRQRACRLKGNIEHNTQGLQHDEYDVQCIQYVLKQKTALLSHNFSHIV